MKLYATCTSPYGTHFTDSFHKKFSTSKKETVQKRKSLYGEAFTLLQLTSLGISSLIQYPPVLYYYYCTVHLSENPEHINLVSIPVYTYGHSEVN